MHPKPAQEFPESPVDRLLVIMARLRDPAHGCPWDLKQNYASIAKHTLEEAYEVVDAIEKQDFDALLEELGDLLLQIVFYAQMAREEGRFDFAAIAQGIGDKLVRRHPHVFGDAHVESAEAMVEKWEQDKIAERAAKNSAADMPPVRMSALDDVTLALPALARAHKFVQRAARAGFDWNKAQDVFPKLEEEIAELKVEIETGDKARMLDELGDVLFTSVCLAYKAGIDPESALRWANNKFERRFRAMEAVLEGKIRQNTPIKLDEWEKAWSDVKHEI